MTPLPFWCDHPHGRSIIADIIAERPDYWSLRRFAWDESRYPRFKGDNARCLRRLWDVQADAALRLNDSALFHRLNEHNPDDLIERLLDESAEQLTECLPDPLRRVA